MNKNPSFLVVNHTLLSANNLLLIKKKLEPTIPVGGPPLLSQLPKVKIKNNLSIQVSQYRYAFATILNVCVKCKLLQNISFLCFPNRS